MATENRTRTDRHGPDHGHHHRDVSGGWLRPAVFGAMDGLVTNVSLIAGVGAGGGTPHFIILTGLAGLAAAEVRKERFELEHHPDAERQELAGVFRMRGVEAGLADAVARQLSEHPE